MLTNAYKTLKTNYLLSMFVIKHNDAFVFPFLSARFKFCLLRHILIFCVFHVVHVSTPYSIRGSVLVRRLNPSE